MFDEQRSGVAERERQLFDADNADDFGDNTERININRIGRFDDGYVIGIESFDWRKCGYMIIGIAVTPPVIPQ